MLRGQVSLLWRRVAGGVGLRLARPHGVPKDDTTWHHNWFIIICFGRALNHPINLQASMLSLVTFSTVAYSPMARPAAERSLSSLRGYATDYWKESDYAFVGPEAMAVPTDSVEAFVER